MREIKFRGMKANGEWVVGYYLVHIPTDEHKIHYLSKILGMSTAIVDKKTVGQFTGLIDKNGKEIFEGDVVKEGGLVSVIEWANERYCYRTTTGTIGLYGFCGEIIGNIYENPELISPKTDSTPNRI